MVAADGGTVARNAVVHAYPRARPRSFIVAARRSTDEGSTGSPGFEFPRHDPTPIVRSHPSPVARTVGCPGRRVWAPY